MADSVMYVATPRFLRRQPTVIAEAQRVKNKENLQVEKLVKLPTSVGCKRALKKWTIGWLLVILVQSAFCLNPFITPVVAGEIVEVNSCCIQFFIGTALVISCIGLGSYVALLCVGNGPKTLGELFLWSIGGSAFAITISILLAFILLVRSHTFQDNVAGATRDTESGKSTSRRRQEKSSSGGL
eukprot:GHVQ01039198.1.p1 GENE.GHVQ01039198.1~~GHVQ01039198.1.p1  ORF type:complete len:184 (+),score=13.82 GHVQ01039198.1:76-627(+)